MLLIHVCDDDLAMLSQIRDSLSYIQKNGDLPLDVIVMEQSSTEFLAKVKPLASLNNVYILDIELGQGEFGLDLARKIREFDGMGHIIFLTTYPDYLQQTFDYFCAPIAYLIKSSQDKMQVELANVLEKIHQQVILSHSQTNKKTFIECRSGSKWYCIPIDEVITIEYLGNHQICINAINQMVTFYGNMKEIIKAYPSLMRIHQSFIINPHYIQSIDLKARLIIMTDDQTCPIGRTYWLKVKRYQTVHFY